MKMTIDQAPLLEQVYIVDTKAGDRESLACALERHGLEVSTHKSGADFLCALRSDVAGAVVAGVDLGDMSGFALIDAMRAQGRALPLLLLNEADDWTFATRAVNLRVFGFFRKPVDVAQLAERVHEALAVDLEAVAWRRQWEPFFASLAALSERERQVMELVVSGHANKVIAFDLGISEKTVEAHRGKVMRKMQVDSLAELVRVNVMLEQAGRREMRI